jgi:D-lactate dehydrogenase (cytochrome)
LRSALGEDAISTDDEDLLRHGYSEWSSINIDQLPVAVAYPQSTEQVSQIAKVCLEYKIPMSMYHSPFCGQAIDVSKYRILEAQA